ncbi:hypothetical protein PO002_42810 [Cupriavidus necator]|uniref:hypothetical protein n=1 Tax=Cupriavidus necator TaxID=106590 RepID=UPI0039C18810
MLNGRFAGAFGLWRDWGRTAEIGQAGDGEIDAAGQFFWEDMVEQVPLPGQGILKTSSTVRRQFRRSGFWIHPYADARRRASGGIVNSPDD